MNKAVFGKTMKKRRNIKLVTTGRRKIFYFQNQIIKLKNFSHKTC